MTEISIGEKEKWTNKGTDKQYMAVLLLHNTTHHYQALYKIQNPNPSSCWEIFDGKKSLQTDRQTNIITEKAKTIYPLYTLYRGYNCAAQNKVFITSIVLMSLDIVSCFNTVLTLIRWQITIHNVLHSRFDFVYFDALRPSKRFFSHFRTFPGLNQYYSEDFKVSRQCLWWESKPWLNLT